MLLAEGEPKTPDAQTNLALLAETAAEVVHEPEDVRFSADAVVDALYGTGRIWLSIFGLSFQPGEIAKILIVLFLAAYLADNRELLSVMRRSRSGLKYPDFRALVPLLAMWIIAMLIVILERDLGSALLFFGIFFNAVSNILMASVSCLRFRFKRPK